MMVPETQIEIEDGVWVKKRKVEPLLIWFDREMENNGGKKTYGKKIVTVKQILNVIVVHLIGLGS